MKKKVIHRSQKVSQYELAVYLAWSCIINRDAFFAVDGDPGTGKSSFLVGLKRIYHTKKVWNEAKKKALMFSAGIKDRELYKRCYHFKPNYSHKWKDDIIYTREEFKNRVENSERGGFLCIDEGTNVFFSRDAMVGSQKEVIKLLEISRSKNLVVGVTMPNFWNMDASLRNRRCRFWIHIESWGLGYILMGDRNPFGIENWHRSENEKLLKTWNEGRISPERCKQNYVGTILFNRLPKKLEKRYDEIKIMKTQGSWENEEGKKVTKYTKREVERMVEKGWRVKACAVVNYFLEEGLLASKHGWRKPLAKFFGKSKGRVDDYLREARGLVEPKSTKL